MIVFRVPGSGTAHRFTDCGRLGKSPRLLMGAADASVKLCTACTARAKTAASAEVPYADDFGWACLASREIGDRVQLGFAFHLHRDCRDLRAHLHLSDFMAWGDVPQARWRCGLCDYRKRAFGERSVAAAGAGLPTLGRRH